ncbi:MAG: SDR family NAD(P)-dependent oxidoreductase [Pseudomonadota bacterium]
MKGKHLLVTGGAGSFGRAFAKHVLDGLDGPDRLTVLSRDERKHHEMEHELARHSDRLRFVIGDMRDALRVDEIVAGADIIVHAAAMKHVPSTEANPMECVRTNVEGARNLTLAALRHGIERVVALSTDKAVSPSTVYGASKLTMERLMMQANAPGQTQCSVVRYANVFASGGSVVPLFLSLRKTGVLPITDPEMTRFSISMQEGIELVLFALNEGRGGEIVVPIAPSYRVGDVAEAIAPEAEKKLIGARPGEKMHEAMFSLTEAPFVVRRGRYYIILPTSGGWSRERYCAETGAAPIDRLFDYESGSNDEWLSVETIREMVFQGGGNAV